MIAGNAHESPEKRPASEVTGAARKQQPDRDDAREEKRARVYGLGLEELLDQTIIVPPGQHVRLSGLNRKESEPGLARLQPKDLDEVKRWLGVSDDLGVKQSRCCKLPAGIPATATLKGLRTLDARSQRSLYDLAHEYVHGDSRPLAPYKATLNTLLDRASIVGVFLWQDIEIHTGAVLEVAKDVKILFARHIRIWRGGLLKLTGPTKVDCVSITGDLLSMGVVSQAQLPAFAKVLAREAAND